MQSISVVIACLLACAPLSVSAGPDRLQPKSAAPGYQGLTCEFLGRAGALSSRVKFGNTGQRSWPKGAQINYECRSSGQVTGGNTRLKDVLKARTSITQTTPDPMYVGCQCRVTSARIYRSR